MLLKDQTHQLDMADETERIWSARPNPDFERLHREQRRRRELERRGEVVPKPTLPGEKLEEHAPDPELKTDETERIWGASLNPDFEGQHRDQGQERIRELERRGAFDTVPEPTLPTIEEDAPDPKLKTEDSK